jgi:hypothetical protein
VAITFNGVEITICQEKLGKTAMICHDNEQLDLSLAANVGAMYKRECI